jgi:hypothetical protein
MFKNVLVGLFFNARLYFYAISLTPNIPIHLPINKLGYEPAFNLGIRLVRRWSGDKRQMQRGIKEGKRLV